MSMPRTAACLCGQLTLEVSGEPVHLHACTCTQCQRASGSVMTVSAWYPQDEVRVCGQYTLYRPDESVPDSFATFCPRCGTGGFFRSGAFLPGTIGIRVGSFADSAYPKPAHIHFWANRPHWLAAPADTELHAEMGG